MADPPVFRDHFSGHADDYERYRPGYPPALFDWLASLPAARRLAWDVGTGNGQVATDLADRFAGVLATDLSLPQLARARRRKGVLYARAAAEAAPLADRTLDLITASQALHWFDLDRFYAEVRRVLAPGGAIVAWSSSRSEMDPAVKAALAPVAARVRPYWPPERRWVDEAYRTIPFPFAEIAPPELWSSVEWGLDELLGYVGTWSATRRYRAAHGADPIAPDRAAIAAAWGEPLARRLVRFPLHIRAGRVAR
jgi:SAM-dependent methyltransferase